MNKKIIGIMGFISAGKDTVADYLCNFEEFRRESFASSLKDAVSSVFGWDRTMLEGRTKEARAWRELPDAWWAERLGIPHLTPRWVLQYWGTEVIRKGFNDSMWIASLENKLRTSHDNIVISDCRFPNEIAAIKAQGGKIIWVQRGPLPEWYDVAVETNQGNFNHMATAYPEVHASEWAWAGADFDHIIDNNGSIQDLYDQIKLIISQESNPLDAIESPLYIKLADNLHTLS
jgi:hypothetical protein